MFASLLAGLVLMGSAGSAPETAGPPTPLALLTPSRIGEVAVSPDGRRLAWARREGGGEVVILLDRATGRRTVLFAESAREIEALAWKDGDRLLVGRRAGGSAGLSMIDAASGAETDLGAGELADAMTSDPLRLLVRDAGGGRSGRRARLFSIELTGLKRTLIELGDETTLAWSIDAAGQATTRYDGDARGLTVLSRRPDGRWERAYSVKTSAHKALGDTPILGFTGQPGKFFVAAPSTDATGARTRELRTFDFVAGRYGPRLWSHPKHDVAGVRLEGPGKTLSAVCYWAEALRCDPLDAAGKVDAARLDALFGETRTRTLAAHTPDGAVQALLVSGPDQPETLYVFDRAGGAATPIESGLPQVAPAALGAMKPWRWTARNGLALGGYLTLPASGSGKPPLIVMPHGGPEFRDRLRYDPAVQAFAARGYAVFQPNFRGSGGFGAAFAEQGHGQWGLTMQDDVMDGVADLISRGLVDPDRICIVGASYGGYVALQAGAAAPETFKCVVSRAGVADLSAMMAFEKSRARQDPYRYRYWLASIGDPALDGARLRETSPVTRADGYRPPVLLLHGENDSVVSIGQSRLMERALTSAGRPVTLVAYPGEDHDGWALANEADALERTLAFVEAAIGR